MSFTHQFVQDGKGISICFPIIIIITTRVRTDMGGPNANRSVEEGAAGMVWLATEDDDKLPESGLFFRDRDQIKFDAVEGV